jgi:penicillin-binding protein 1A
MTTPTPTSDEPSGPKPQRDILSLAEPAPPPAPSLFERLIARVAPLGPKAMVEGRRLVRMAVARTRPAGVEAARLAHAAGRRTAAVLGPWREPIVSGATRVGTGVRRILSRIRLRHALIVTGSFAVLLVLIVGYSIATLPLDGGLQVDPTPSALVVEADTGETFATRGVFKGTKVTAADVPAHLAQAVVAIEDRRFYSHLGVDPWGILRAAWRNWQAGGTREGGSTITQDDITRHDHHAVDNNGNVDLAGICSRL